jgi:hypothetical protein
VPRQVGHPGAAAAMVALARAIGRLAAAEASRRPLLSLTPGFTADRGAAARAVSEARHILGEDCDTACR